MGSEIQATAGVAYLEGRVVPIDEARVPVTDRGFLYGDGVFTSVRLERGEPRWWPLHLERLVRDAAAIRIALPDEATLTAAVRKVGAAIGGLAQARVSITRRIDAAGPTSRGGEPGRLVVLGRPLTDAQTVLRAVTVAREAGSGLRRHKLVNYLDHVLALQDAARQGADEALYTDAEVGAVEFATGALFVAIDGAWVVPHADGPLLDSVARRALLAAQPGRIVERKIDLGMLSRASEIVHANAVRGPRAVVAVDDVTYEPGPLLAALRAAFEQRSSGAS